MYYDTIEQAIEAAPDCTHVLTTGIKWSGDRAIFGKFIPAFMLYGCFYPDIKTSGDGFIMGDTGLVVILDRSDPSITVTPLTFGARSDQAASESASVSESTTASDRQIGGDHYKSLKIQPIEYIDANNLPYLEGNVIKYVTRHASKNGVQDIDKAIHYLELIKQFRYGDSDETK